MQDFLLLFRAAAPDPAFAPSPEEMQAAIPKWQNWMAEVAQKGNLIHSQPLEFGGKTVRTNGVTDGPFAEVKELVMGYLIFKAEDDEAAVSMAKGCPILDMPAGSVEVRPITTMEGMLRR